MKNIADDDVMALVIGRLLLLLLLLLRAPKHFPKIKDLPEPLSKLSLILNQNV